MKFKCDSLEIGQKIEINIQEKNGGLESENSARTDFSNLKNIFPAHLMVNESFSFINQAFLQRIVVISLQIKLSN